MQHDSPYEDFRVFLTWATFDRTRSSNDTLISREVRRLVACRLDGRGVGR